MAHDQHPAHGDAHGHDDHGGTGKYWLVFIALCVLTSASVLTYTPLWRDVFSPQVGWAFMMAVSCTKALLVMMFFMHLIWEANWKYVLTIPAAMMSIFLICMLWPDVGRRTNYYSDQRWRRAAEPLETHAAHLLGADDQHGASGANH